VSHDMEQTAGDGILANKLLWMCIGVGVFLLIAFIMPTPPSLIETIEKYGFAEKLMEWEVAHTTAEAARKTQIVLGIIPMAVIFFATEAIPIGLTGVLMPTLAYFFHLLPRKMIGKTFAGDAPLFLLGVLAMGVAVGAVYQHVRGGLFHIGPRHVRLYDAGHGGGIFRCRGSRKPRGHGGT